MLSEHFERSEHFQTSLAGELFAFKAKYVDKAINVVSESSESWSSQPCVH